MSKLSILERAASFTTNKSDLPDSTLVVETLLDLEKIAKKDKTSNSFNNLVGSWNLRFITGTKKTRKKAGIVLGAGRYIPRLVTIKITYENSPKLNVNNVNIGRVKNFVQLAFLQLSLTGPVKFITPKNILAFDFTTLTIAVSGFKFYDGYIRGGAIKEAEFEQIHLSQQAFFSYFLIQENLIAARGRGGGLALWSRDLETSK